MKLVPGQGVQLAGSTLSRTDRLRLPEESGTASSVSGEASLVQALAGMDFRVTPGAAGSVVVNSLRVHAAYGVPFTVYRNLQTLTGLLSDTTYYLYVVADQTELADGLVQVTSGQVNVPKPSGNLYFFSIDGAATYPPRDTIIETVPPAFEEVLVLKYTGPQTNSAAYAYYLIAEVDTDEDAVATVRQKHLGPLYIVGAPMLFNATYSMTADPD